MCANFALIQDVVYGLSGPDPLKGRQIVAKDLMKL